MGRDGETVAEAMPCYRGVVDPEDDYRVVVIRPDGSTLDPARSLALASHSPDGFAWGYDGSGPAQLALAMLLDHGVEDDRALRLYQAFKADIVARLAPWPDPEPWSFPVRVLEDWIAKVEGGAT